jgi:hypothetical protein
MAEAFVIENRLSHPVFVFNREDLVFSGARKCFVFKQNLPAPEPIHRFPAFTGGFTPRVRLDAKIVQVINGIPIRMEIPGMPENVPDIIPNTLFIVSRRFAEAAHLFKRTDFLYPDGMVRDADDRPVGCIAFGRPNSGSKQ